MADFALSPDSFFRLAPGIELVSGTDIRRFVVRYGETACGEIEVPADDRDTLALLAALAKPGWTPVSALAGAARPDSLAGLLETFLDQEWLHLSDGAAPARCGTRVSTLGGVINDMAVAAAGALELGEATLLSNALLDIGAAWRRRKVSAPPPWSGLTLDLTPFEFSANFDPTGVQLRAVGEPQSVDPSAASYWRAAMGVGANLEANSQANIGRLRAVQDLFAPADPGVPLAAFYGVGIGRGRSLPRFKIYLSPAAHTRGAEAEILGRACERLGLRASWDRIRAAGEDRLWTLACLDLAAGPDARFKIYETLVDMDRSVERLDGTASEDSIEGLATMLASALPPSVRGFNWGMLSYTLRASGEPTRTFGVAFRPGARQGPVRQHIETLFVRLGLDPGPYTRLFRALAAACDEPVEHSYVTVQRVAGLPRVTTYIAPRLYRSRFGAFEAPTWPSPVPSFSARRGVPGS